MCTCGHLLNIWNLINEIILTDSVSLRELMVAYMGRAFVIMKYLYIMWLVLDLWISAMVRKLFDVC